MKNALKQYGLIAAFALLPLTQALAKCYSASWTPNSRYEIRAKGAEVYDKKTQLTWKRCAEGMKWDGNTCTGEPLEMSWFKMKDTYPASGKGWRVPNIDELATLRSGTDYDKEDLDERKETGCTYPAINATIFPGKQDIYIQSSSAYVGDSRHPGEVAGGVGFYDGSVHYYGFHTNQRAVRLVRAGQWLGPLAQSGKVEPPYTFQPGSGYREMFAYCEKKSDADYFEKFAKEFAGQDPDNLIPQARLAAAEIRAEKQAVKEQKARNAREAAQACARLYPGKPVSWKSSWCNMWG